MQIFQKQQLKEKIGIIGASQVKNITKTSNSKNKTFELEPKSIFFQARIPFPEKLRNDLAIKRKKQAVTIKVIQLPIVSNNATTGWKLQWLLVQIFRNGILAAKIGYISCYHM